MIILATGGYGFFLSYEMSQRYKELKELKKLFFLLKSEIGFNQSTIKEGIEMISKRTELFKKYLEDLSRLNNDEFLLKWDEIWKNVVKETHLKERDIIGILSMRDGFGINDKDAVIGRMDMCLEELDMSINELTNIMPNRQKIYKSLGICLGLILTIIII